MTVAESRLSMVLDSGSGASSISQATHDALSKLHRIEAVGQHAYVLRNVRIGGQPVDDLRVRISRRVTSLGIDGLLGIDFLGRFTDIHFHVPSMRLTLSDEPN